MPRSRRRIDIDNKAIVRGQTILKEALADFKGKLQATTVTNHIQGNLKWSSKIEKDKPLVRYLVGQGLKELVREALAEWGLLSPKGEASPQLELFAVDERDIVHQIGMARIWVPSRGAHIQYHDVPDDVLEEASVFYQALGQGNLRTSDLLHQLAALRKQKKPRKAKAA